MKIIRSMDFSTFIIILVTLIGSTVTFILPYRPAARPTGYRVSTHPDSRMRRQTSVPTPDLVSADQLTPDELKDKNAETKSSFYELNPIDSSFSYGFDSSNGLSTNVKGYMRNDEQVMEGTYTMFANDGAPIKISYTADGNGYVPSGDAIHPSIVKALAYIKSLPPSPENESEEKLR